MTDNEKFLFVDDEQNVLDSMRRQLRKRFTIRTALSGEEGLRILREQGPFAVIVSDMRMPGMDGIELLKRVKDLYPETVRIMLTGNADQETAIEAVNSGQIFRFLTKPCSTAILVPALALAQHHYRLIRAEKDLLQKTLTGSVTVLAELLSQANPTVFSAGQRIREHAGHVARSMELPNIWEVDVAALLAQIGCMSLPSDVINKKYAGLDLDGEEQAMWESYPEIGARLLEKIPRLESVTTMIRWQQRPFAAYDKDTDSTVFEEVIAGSQILKAIIDFDLLRQQGLSKGKAIARMRSLAGEYNPEIVDLLSSLPVRQQSDILSLPVEDLGIGMIAEEDIVAKNGTLVLPRGQKITWASLQGLLNFNRKVGILEPVRVSLPPDEDQEDQTGDDQITG
jgi:response regulator RpfG family c-di-GMP phosphodiesterase